MATSNTTEDAKPLKTDRRTDLDGGLDTRSSVVAQGPNRAIALGNFRLTTTGRLTKRKGGQQLCTVRPYSNASTDLPAAILSDGGAGGTLAAGTYTVRYSLGSVADGSAEIGASPDSNALVLGANRLLQINIPSPNSGNAIGQVATGFDDPQNGGFLFSGARFAIYAKKDADPNFTKQLGITAFQATGSVVVATGRVGTMSSYSNNLATAPTNSQVPVPIRGLHWHPLIDATLGFIGERGFALQKSHTTPLHLALAKDLNGNTFTFSRLPTRISMGIVDRVMCVSDGMGRPKRLNTPPGSGNAAALQDPTLWAWRKIGADAPGAAPTNTLAAGTFNGVFRYVVTFVYEAQRQDGTAIRSESNSSATLTTANLVNQQVTLTRPTVVDAANSGIVAWQVYRTLANQTTPFFLIGNVAIATTTFVDATADANVLATRPPDKDGKIPNDVPPVGLDLITEHDGRLFGAVSIQVVADVADGTHTAGQIFRIKRSNEMRYSKVRTLTTVAIGQVQISVTPPDVANLDGWSADFLFFPCGDMSAITAIKSFRGVLYVFKETEIGVVEGSDDQGISYRAIWRRSGAMENSVIECGNFLLAFDQALGPIVISGYAVDDLGYESIQQDWLLPVTTVSGEAVSGGGRGSTQVVSAIWDTIEAEARWVIADYNVDPTSGYATGTAPTFFEYVAQMPRGKPNGAFTRFTGAVSGTTRDRRILAQDSCIVGFTNQQFRARDILYGDYHGRIVNDDKLESDLDGVTATAISIRATFPFFFGDNLEMVKLFRYLYALVTMGATSGDAMTFSCQSLSKGSTSPIVIRTINGGAALAGLDQMVRLDFTKIDSVNVVERGVQIVVSGSASSGPTSLSSLGLKYQDVSEIRNAP